MAATREKLDRLLQGASCDDPNCQHEHGVIVSCAQHPGAPASVLYLHGGRLQLSCCLCAKVLLEVALNDGAADALPPEVARAAAESAGQTRQ